MAHRMPAKPAWRLRSLSPARSVAFFRSGSASLQWPPLARVMPCWTELDGSDVEARLETCPDALQSSPKRRVEIRAVGRYLNIKNEAGVIRRLPHHTAISNRASEQTESHAGLAHCR